MNFSMDENKKRRKEFVFITLLAVFFLVLTWIEFRLFGISRSLPYVHSIFFFGLVNFNIILFLLLTFLIFRNVVKVFSEKKGGIGGSSLKSKLIAAFVGFSFVPTALMFLVSVFYINNSFDKWFSEKMAGVLRSSLEVTNAYHLAAKKKNYHFASVISGELASEKLKPSQIKKKLTQLQELYSLDAVEYYPNMFSDRIVSSTQEKGAPLVPPVSLEFKQKGIQQKVDASIIHDFDEGNLVRVIVPVKGASGAIVVSSLIPISLISKMDDIAAAYEELRDVNPLEYPLKSIYLIILVLMTLVILLGATWFGFYLARQLSIPLEMLTQAAQKVATGSYVVVDAESNSPEINELIKNFNQMTSDLKSSQARITEANRNLEEHSRYVEVVLSNVSAGVVALDYNDNITTINRHAAELLEIDPQKYVGQPVDSILSSNYIKLYDDLLSVMKLHKARSIQKEIHINVKDRPIPLQITLTVLYDENEKELGKVVVFDDLSMLVSAQRSAAWTEVARRIAHEIKNPLTPIRLAAQRLQKKFSHEITDPAFPECTSMIINQVDDLKNLVNEFSNFAKLPDSKPVMADLHRVINEATQLFRQGHKNVEFDLELDSKLPEFLFDPDQVRRVITNLVDNSVGAVQNEAEGRISISTHYDPLLKIVRISVIDNGMGIPKHIRDRVFEPYVTTKAGGTGLGLAIVKRTVEDHNGFIRAFQNRPRGTKIVIELPVVRSRSKGIVVGDLEKMQEVDNP